LNRSGKILLFLTLIIILGAGFYLYNTRKHQTPRLSTDTAVESADIMAEPVSDDKSFPRYEGGPRVSTKEDYLPADDIAVPDKLESGEEDASVFDSSDIPPKIRDIAEQLIELKEDFDYSTLKTVNKALENVPYVDMEADDAELRPTGDGVKLKINIPTDNIKKKK
jgi:hypothetical protein